MDLKEAAAQKARNVRNGDREEHELADCGCPICLRALDELHRKDIRAVVSGGQVQNVENIPPGIRVSIMDYDPPHNECNALDELNSPYSLTVYNHPSEDHNPPDQEPYIRVLINDSGYAVWKEIDTWPDLIKYFNGYGNNDWERWHVSNKEEGHLAPEIVAVLTKVGEEEMITTPEYLKYDLETMRWCPKHDKVYEKVIGCTECEREAYQSQNEQMTSSKPTKVGSFHSQEKEKKMARTNRTTLGEWS